jgi:hypothetical protein
MESAKRRRITKMTNLSTHFTLEELTGSSTAVRLGIDNAIPAELLSNLQNVATGLELVRALLGNIPMSIDSGYRCAALNKAVGGASDSAHMQGYAADFICPSFGVPLDIVKAIQASAIQFDQLIQEGTWVHISFDPRTRMEVLTATFTNGVASYKQGV